jgi:hypothetical protein
MCTQLVLSHATCARVQGNIRNMCWGWSIFKAACARNMCCCTQHVHVFKATFARKICCCTQHLHARNMCTCACATCLHMLHATFSRAHMYVSGYGSSYRPICACVVARNMCTCKTCVVVRSARTCAHGARNMCTCVCSCLGLAMGLAMNQHMHATCVVARNMCTGVPCARLHIVYVSKLTASCTCCTQHAYVPCTNTAARGAMPLPALELKYPWAA